MGLFSSIGGLLSKGLGLLGASQASNQNRFLSKKLLKKINQEPGPLQIPEAFLKLQQQLGEQIGQLGDAQRVEIGEAFNQSLSQALDTLRRRGITGSNLTANLATGSTRARERELLNLEDRLLAQRLGLQQQIGLQGLSTSAQERAQQRGIQSQLLQPLVSPLLGGQSSGGLGGGLGGILGSIGKLF